MHNFNYWSLRKQNIVVEILTKNSQKYYNCCSFFFFYSIILNIINNDKIVMISTKLIFSVFFFFFYFQIKYFTFNWTRKDSLYENNKKCKLFSHRKNIFLDINYLIIALMQKNSAKNKTQIMKKQIPLL